MQPPNLLASPLFLAPFWPPLLLSVFFLLLSFVSTDSNMDFVNAEIAVVVGSGFGAGAGRRLALSLRSQLRVLRRGMRFGALRADFLSSAEARLRRDVVAVLSMMPCDDTWRLAERLRERAIVHLAVTESGCARVPHEGGLAVTVGARGSQLPQLLLDLRADGRLSWDNLLLLHDGSLDRSLVDRIAWAMSQPLPLRPDSAASIAVFDLQPRGADWDRREQVLDVLRRLPGDRAGNNFLALVSGARAGLLLETAQSLGLGKPRDQWLLVLPDANRSPRRGVRSLRSLLKDGLNVAFVANASTQAPDHAQRACPDGVPCHAHELLRALVASLDRRIAEEANQSQQVSEEEWEALRPSRRMRAAAILQYIREWVSARGACGRCERWALAGAETWGSSFDGGDRDGARLLRVASWTPAAGAVFSDELFPHVAHAFRGRELPVVTFHNPPWQIITYTNRTDENRKYRGIVFEVLNVLAKNLNFSYSLFLPGDNGQSLINESVYPSEILPEDEAEDLSKIRPPWNALIDVVQKQKVFLGAGAFTATARRKMAVNFTEPLGLLAYSFIVSRPRQLGRAALFMYPFTTDTWICMVVAVLVTGPTLYFVHSRSPFYEFFGFPKGGLARLNNCLWYMYGALLQQGGLYVPRADSGRLLVGAWWLMVLVVMSTYSGNLVAFLTFPRFEAAIESVEAVNQRSGVSWGLLHGGLLHQALRETEEARLQELLAGAELHEQLDEELVQRVRGGTHVLLAPRHHLLYLTKRQFQATGSCHFFIAPENFLLEEVSMIVSKDNPHLDRINKEMHAMRQGGLLAKWLDESLPLKDRCAITSAAPDAANHMVNLNDMQGSFFMLFLGVGISVLTIIGECFVRRYTLKREKRLVRPFIS